MRYLLSLYWSYLKFVLVGMLVSGVLFSVYLFTGTVAGFILALIIGGLLMICLFVVEYVGENPRIISDLLHWAGGVRKSTSDKKDTETPKTLG